MNKSEIMNLLSSGFCELTFTDANSVEDTVVGTTALQHLPDSHTHNNWQGSENAIVFFNVNSEETELLLLSDVVDVEALTGAYAECTKRKLQASDDYLESIGLFSNSDDDLDAMEHPEL